MNTPQRILIVEDESINRSLIAITLGDYGFNLLNAENGEQGLASALANLPDLILLDICMPGMDGFEVCAWLKSNPATAGIPVIFLTGLTDTEQKLRAFQLGGVDYITKPFEPREVLARVILHLDQRQLLRRLQQRLEAYERGEGADDDAATPRVQAHTLSRVSDYLVENLAVTPSLDDLARIARSNRTSLNQDFQRLYGMSVFDWLREQRLLRAAQQLKSTRHKVVEIAHSVGYTSHAAFTAAFHQRFGFSPRQYRAADDE